MPPKRSTKPTVRRGSSARVVDMEVNQKAAREAQRKVDEATAATAAAAAAAAAEKKAARRSSVAGTKKETAGTKKSTTVVKTKTTVTKKGTAGTTPTKTGDKRKPSVQESLDDESDAEDEPPAHPRKRSKSSDEEDSQPEPEPTTTPDTPAIKEEHEETLTLSTTTHASTTPAPPEVNPTNLATTIARILEASIARQISQSLHAALLPCLDLVDPLMKHTHACGAPKGEQEVDAQTAATRVLDAVERVKRDWTEALESPVEAGVPDDAFEESFGGEV